MPDHGGLFPHGRFKGDGNIAGLYNEAGTVLGLMPHPERLADPALGGTDGKPMFDSLIEALH
jgi:phosphoribosylformylglycinamidine synthase